MVTQTCNPSTPELEAEELKAPGQPGLHGKTVSQKQTTKRTNSKKKKNQSNKIKLGI
jgi:hypothetical protein